MGKEQGGFVIDLRDGAEDEHRRDPDVPFGYVVIYAKDGGVKLEVKDEPKDAIEQLLEKIIDKTLDTAGSIAEAATNVLGDGKVTKPAGSPAWDQRTPPQPTYAESAVQLQTLSLCLNNDDLITREVGGLFDELELVFRSKDQDALKRSHGRFQFSCLENFQLTPN